VRSGTSVNRPLALRTEVLVISAPDQPATWESSSRMSLRLYSRKIDMVAVGNRQRYILEYDRGVQSQHLVEAKSDGLSGLLVKKARSRTQVVTGSDILDVGPPCTATSGQ
jgi:hypothetical protein